MTKLKLSDIVACNTCGHLIHKDDAKTDKGITKKAKTLWNFPVLVSESFDHNPSPPSGLSKEHTEFKNGERIDITYYCRECIEKREKKPIWEKLKSIKSKLKF